MTQCSSYFPCNPFPLDIACFCCCLLFTVAFVLKGDKASLLAACGIENVYCANRGTSVTIQSGSSAEEFLCISEHLVGHLELPAVGNTVVLSPLLSHLPFVCIFQLLSPAFLIQLLILISLPLKYLFPLFFPFNMFLLFFLYVSPSVSFYCLLPTINTFCFLATPSLANLFHFQGISWKLYSTRYRNVSVLMFQL